MNQAQSSAGHYFGDHKVIINRTNRVLVVRVNNNEWYLDPGENQVPAFIVPYAIKQNPRRGSLQMSSQFESLVALPGVTPEDECGMLGPDEDGHDLDELIDRKAQPHKGQQEKIQVARSSMAEGNIGGRELDRTLANTKVGLYDEA